MKGVFLKQFLKNPTSIGAICPSSKALAREITSKVELKSALNIAELGPGTGVFTDAILSLKHPKAKFFSVELNENMFNLMQKRFGDHNGVTVFNDSATNLKNMRNELMMEKLDVIVSGLPWASFPESLQDSLLEAIFNNLHDEGYFATFAYVQGMLLPAAQKFKKKLKQHFSEVEKSKVVWKNTPPAFVYRCRK
ncbi:rRNA adenine N-6-methyltransferase family protein [Lentisphaerota bacterium WC36G]|nr:hypothetical protein LJT99_10290 [Lentisphaerae bacterium WC36]